MNYRVKFTDKDLIIFLSFLILAIVYIFSVIFKTDLIYIRAIINYISFKLILYAIIKEAHRGIIRDIEKLESSGEITAVDSTYDNLKKEARKYGKKIFVCICIGITILTVMQVIINGIVGDIIGDTITFFAFLLCCETSVITDFLCCKIERKVLKLDYI